MLVCGYGILCLLADENLNNDIIIRSVLRQNSAISFQRTQKVGLDGCSDPEILLWAADHNAVVVPQDINTMIDKMIDNDCPWARTY
ncbi:DUF5615 family PIN-like protein [Thermostichus vulcanus]|uniref:DUF5615 family PIN-like protein n=1 Tax=Thermostichus vulcanus str. 'Rupite' TaxID=2813851 RepID=A0ABT0CB32_THEVL|nr:DUF5615 family PIN-like protein [Thermostichus vulcanus str. 'Rupite']